MDYVFGKPNELRLSRLESDPVRIPTESLKSLYMQRFGDLSCFFERLLAREYDAAFRHYNNDDIVYSFRNDNEIAFAGYFPFTNGRPDVAVLGISAHGQSSDFDTKSLATPHRPVTELVHHMNKGILFDGRSDLPEVELHSRESNDVSALESRLEPLLRRFDGLLYSTKIPDRPEPKVLDYQIS